MMQLVLSILVCLLLLWLVSGHLNDNSVLASSSKATIVWTVLTLLLVASLSMLAKKQASASEQEVYELLEVPSVKVTLITQE